MTKSLFHSLNHTCRDFFAVKPIVESQQSITQWFDSPLGVDILRSEQSALNTIMPKIYGYHLMQLSVLEDVELSALSPVTHHFSLGVGANDACSPKGIACFESLPIQPESIDAVLLHHVLEYSTNPHQLLREAARTIIPNGYIVVVGFNPLASLAMKKHVSRIFTGKDHWCYHSLGHKRVEDWIRVLDFEPVFLQFGFYGLPFSTRHHQRLDRMFAKMLPFCGAYYVMAARKSVIPMTMIKQPANKMFNALPNWVKGGVAIPRKPVVHSQTKPQPKSNP